VVFRSPAGIAYDPVNERMYVTQATPTFIAGVRAIDTNTDPPSLKGPPIPVGDFPLGIAYDPVHGSMYVANEGSNTVQVIQITSVSRQ
jgi:DNA-binding beta-propeller fold protein YncE